MSSDAGLTPMRTFWITAAATFIGFLDVTIVNVSIPDIAESFDDAGLSTLSWVINAYVILFAALLVPSGRLADLLGRKKVFLIGVGLFTVASLVAAAAPSIGVLIAARVVQGAAAAAMLPSALALLLADFPPQRWASAIAMWGAVASLASAIGPLLGGVLVDALDWRAIFVINGPIGLATVLLGHRMLRETREPAGAKRPDLVGGVLLAAAVAALVLALVQSDDWGWGDAATLGTLAAAALLAAALAYRITHHESPILELDMARERNFLVANLSSTLFGLAFFALLLCSILFLTQVWDYSVLEAGLAIAPGPFASAFSSVLGGRLAEKHGQRAVILGGAAIYTAAMLWLATVPGDEPAFLGEWLPAYVVAGIGVGLVYPAQTSAAAAAVPPLRFATGLALNITFRQIGASIGIAILVTILGAEALGAGARVTLGDFQDGFLLCGIGSALVFAVTLLLRRPAPAPAAAAPARSPASPA